MSREMGKTEICFELVCVCVCMSASVFTCRCAGSKCNICQICKCVKIGFGEKLNAIWLVILLGTAT